MSAERAARLVGILVVCPGTPRGNPGAPRGMAAAYDEHHPDLPAGSVYEEVPLSDLEFCEDDDMYYYECPCGDMFEISTVRARVYFLEFRALRASGALSFARGGRGSHLSAPPLRRAGAARRRRRHR